MATAVHNFQSLKASYLRKKSLAYLRCACVRMRNEWENVVPAKAGIQIKTTKDKRITGEAHTQRVTPYLTFSVSRFSSHVFRFTFSISRFPSHVSPLTSHVSPLTSHVSPLTFSVSRLTFHVSRPPATTPLPGN